MKKLSHSSYLLILFFISTSFSTQDQITPTTGWSHDDQMGHYAIGVAATQIMPEPWLTFFNKNLTGAGDASDYPDFFKNEDPLDFESARHYDDSDVPHNDHTSAGGSEDWELGVISWAAENATKRLTELILANASVADLIYQFGFVSHYAADSTMPFHATVNFNGQDTGNTGVHDRLEELVFQQYGDDTFANVTLRTPKYVDDVYTATKANIASGLALVPSYLAADTLAVAEAVAQKNQAVGTRLFYNLMNESIIERIELAIQFTADLWFTAITNAQPPTTSSTTESTSSSAIVTISTPTSSSQSSSTAEDSNGDDSPYPFFWGTVSMSLIPIVVRKLKLRSKIN